MFNCSTLWGMTPLAASVTPPKMAILINRQKDWNWWWTIKIGVKIPSIFTKTMWRNCRKTPFGAWMFPQTFWCLPVVSDSHPKMKDEPCYGMKQPGLVSFGNIVHTRMQNKWRFSTAMLGGMSLPHLPGIFPRRESVAKTVLTQHEDTKSKTPVRGNRAHAIILKTRSWWGMEWEGDRYHMGPLHVFFLKSMDPKSTQLLENLKHETHAFGGPLFSVTPRYRCFALFSSKKPATIRGMILQESSNPQISLKNGRYEQPL